MKNRFTMVVAVHLLLIKDGKLLMSRRFNTGYQDGKYSLPAGHVDANESCLEALIRETKEEIGLDLQPKNINFAHVVHRFEDRESIDFFFSCEKWQGEPKNMEDNKCDRLAWFPLNELPENTVPYVRKSIEKYLKKEKYSELGF